MHVWACVCVRLCECPSWLLLSCASSDRYMRRDRLRQTASLPGPRQTHHKTSPRAEGRHANTKGTHPKRTWTAHKHMHTLTDMHTQTSTHNSHMHTSTIHIYKIKNALTITQHVFHANVSTNTHANSLSPIYHTHTHTHVISDKTHDSIPKDTTQKSDVILLKILMQTPHSVWILAFRCMWSIRCSSGTAGGGSIADPANNP